MKDTFNGHNNISQSGRPYPLLSSSNMQVISYTYNSSDASSPGTVVTFLDLYSNNNHKLITMKQMDKCNCMYRSMPKNVSLQERGRQNLASILVNIKLTNY